MYVFFYQARSFLSFPRIAIMLFAQAEMIMHNLHQKHKVIEAVNIRPVAIPRFQDHNRIPLNRRNTHMAGRKEQGTL